MEAIRRGAVRRLGSVACDSFAQVSLARGRGERRGHARAIVPLFLLLAGLLAHAGTLHAQAATYPNKPIRIVVGFPPGGANDILARMLAAKFQEAWGQPGVVDNRPGANSIIATEFVARSAPDGHTLLVNSTGGMTVNPVLYTKVPFNTERDFLPVSLLVRTPMALVANPSVPAANVRELIALSKANPGKLNYSAGASAFMLAGELFNDMAGTSLSVVPFKGSAQASSAVLSGTTELGMMDLPPVMAHVRAGRLRVMGVTTGRRIAALPDLPTLDEGGLAGYDMVLWTGLFAPAGTPADVVAKLAAESQRLVRSPEHAEKLGSLGVESVGGSPAELAAQIRRELALYGQLVRSRGIKPEQ